MSSKLVSIDVFNQSCRCCIVSSDIAVQQPKETDRLTFPIIILTLNPLIYNLVCSKECYKCIVMETFHNRSAEMEHELNRFTNWDHERS